jgi:hypothetical protein
MQLYSRGEMLDFLNIVSEKHRHDQQMRSMNQMMTNDSDVNRGQGAFGHSNFEVMEAEVV